MLLQLSHSPPFSFSSSTSSLFCSLGLECTPCPAPLLPYILSPLHPQYTESHTSSGTLSYFSPPPESNPSMLSLVALSALSA